MRLRELVLFDLLPYLQLSTAKYLLPMSKWEFLAFVSAARPVWPFEGTGSVKFDNLTFKGDPALDTVLPLPQQGRCNMRRYRPVSLKEVCTQLHGAHHSREDRICEMTPRHCFARSNMRRC